MTVPALDGLGPGARPDPDALLGSIDGAVLVLVAGAVRSSVGPLAAPWEGRLLAALAHPDDAPAVRDLALRASPARRRARLEDGDGAWRDVELTAVDRRSDPQVGGVVVTVRTLPLGAAHEPAGRFWLDAAGRLVTADARWAAITGLTLAHTAGTRWTWAASDPSHLPSEGRHQIRRPDGTTRWVDVRTWVVPDAAGVAGTIDDVSDEVERERLHGLIEAVVEATPDLVIVADADGRTVYLNASARALLGVAPDVGAAELGELDLTVAYPEWARRRLVAEAVPSARRDGVWIGELAVRRPDGGEVPLSQVLLATRDDDGRVTFLASVSRDISDRNELEGRLAHAATHDPLTGLPNRSLLLDRLAMAIARGRRSPRSHAVLFLDLDHFKVVNDSLGHDVGDQLLVEVSERLRAVVRPADTVARFGGDEFVVLCEDVGSERDVLVIATRIEEALAEPFELGDAESFITSSIGVAFNHGGTERPESLLRDADLAMYRAKERGRNRHAIFDEEMRAGALARLDTERALRRAVERHELRVHYQPKVHLRTGAVVGFEALVRWDHPERGLLAPDEFISVAEETGLIVPIGAWVLRQSARQFLRWSSLHPELGLDAVNVNLSGRQLAQAGLVDEVAAVLHDVGLDPRHVVLEITEGVLMEDAAAAIEVLRRLKDLGVRLAIDDFGKGYSSLAYLRRFPVDTLKIDRDFVAGIGRDREDTEIVRLIVTLAHTLGLTAIAEGVEEPGQLAELRRQGCDQAQGFLLARPLPAGDIDDLLAAAPRW